MDLVDKFIHRYGRLPTEVDPDYLEMLRMSKYVINDVPRGQPKGKCANCGASKDDGRRYVDIGLYIDWYGDVEFCGICVEDIAKTMGLFNKYKTIVKALELRIEDLNNQIEELKGRVGYEAVLHEKLIGTLEEFKAYYVSLYPTSNYTDSDRTLDVESSEKTGRLESGSSSGSASTAKPRAIKQTSSSGRKDVPSLAKLLGSDPE